MTGGLDLRLDRRTLLKLGGAGVGLAGLASLAACAPASSSGGGSGTIKMLYFGQQSAATSLQKALQPAITKLDKNAKLQVTAINGTDWNDFLAKVLTQIASGSAPDIVASPPRASS